MGEENQEQMEEEQQGQENYKQKRTAQSLLMRTVNSVNSEKKENVKCQ